MGFSETQYRGGGFSQQEWWVAERVASVSYWWDRDSRSRCMAYAALCRLAAGDTPGEGLQLVIDQFDDEELEAYAQAIDMRSDAKPAVKDLAARMRQELALRVMQTRAPA